MKEVMKPESAIPMKENAGDPKTPEQGPVTGHVKKVQQKIPDEKQGQETILSSKSEDKETRTAGKAAAWDRSMLFL